MSRDDTDKKMVGRGSGVASVVLCQCPHELSVLSSNYTVYTLTLT